jgi:hypothetical protein
MNFNGFLNLPNMQGLLTLLTGILALVVYKEQQADSKRKAAKTLYYEIINAESAVVEIRDMNSKGLLLSDPSMTNVYNRYIFKELSWFEKKYLFINNFNSNEWKKLDIFFQQIWMLNETLKEMASLTSKNTNARMAAFHGILAKEAFHYSEELNKLDSISPTADKQKKLTGKIEKHYLGNVEKFINEYLLKDTRTSFQYQYLPNGSFGIIGANQLDVIDTTISTSSEGIKLRRIAWIDSPNLFEKIFRRYI